MNGLVLVVMAQYINIPGEWTEEVYKTGDYRAIFSNNVDEIAVDIKSNTQGSQVGFNMTVYQRIEYDDVEAKIRSHARTASSRKEAEKYAKEFMEEVNEGKHVLHCIGYEIYEEFVQFYTINDSELPANISSEKFISGLDNEEYGNKITDIGDNFNPEEYDNAIYVDVFPRHISEVEGIDRNAGVA